MLYQHFAEKMYGVCLRYSKDAAEAEDNLQEGFVKVFTKIKQYNFNGSFEGWVRRIIVNTALEKYRKKNYLYPVEDISIFESFSWTDEVVDGISADDLINIIQELPPRYRMVFNLYAIEGYAHKEIAEIMDISEGTSKSNLSRARVILQQKVVLEFGLENEVVNK